MATDGSKIVWSQIRSLRFIHTEPHKIQFSYGHYTEYKVLDLLHKVRGHKLNISAQDAAVISTRATIPKAKYDDLIYLCRHNLVPAHHHDFYNSLPWSDSKVNEEIGVSLDDDNVNEHN